MHFQVKKKTLYKTISITFSNKSLALDSNKARKKKVAIMFNKSYIQSL
jgi:hypothetical protein